MEHFKDSRCCGMGTVWQETHYLSSQSMWFTKWANFLLFMATTSECYKKTIKKEPGIEKKNNDEWVGKLERSGTGLHEIGWF